MSTVPVYIATWKFGVEACETGLRALLDGSSALEGVELGANAVEENPSVNSVGYGGLPNAEGVVELDAAIMDGAGHRAGAVAAMTGIRKPISVARKVMESTPHVMLAGLNARRFALQEGFPSADLTTPESLERWRRWRQEQTAPDVVHFGDLEPRPKAWSEEDGKLDQYSHDTVGICALDRGGNLAAGCTTSGIAWKRPGRVGDSPLIGSGLYVDNEVGAAAATGNGDEIMKVCLSFRVVALMEEGRSPQKSCEEAIRYLLRKRPHHQTRGAACIAISKDGRLGAAATRAGFRAPDRLWQYAYTDGGRVHLVEGIYVDSP